MSEWRQTELENSPGNAHFGELREGGSTFSGMHSSLIYDHALDELSTAVRDKLLRAGVTSLSKLSTLTEEDYRRIKYFRHQWREEIYDLLRRHQSVQVAHNPLPRQYERLLPQLDAAHDLTIGTMLSTRARNALVAAQITSAAALILISPLELLGLRSVGAETMQQLTTLQCQLAERFGLHEIAGTGSLDTVRAVDEVLSARAEARRFDREAAERRMSKRRAAERLSEYGEFFRKEFRLGRLSGELSITDILEDAQQSMTLREFVDYLYAPEDSLIKDAETFTKIAGELMLSLHFESIDQELRSTLGVLPERQLNVLRYRYDPFSPMTLEQVGEQFDVTRERVRQIQKKAEKALVESCQRHHLYRLRSAIRFARAVDRAGGGLHDIEADLKDRQLLQSDQTFDDFLILWRVTNLEQPFLHEQVAAAKEGLSPRLLAIRKEVSRKADKLCRNCGAVQLSWLNATVDLHEVQVALSTLGYQEIFPGWFWRDIASRDVVEGVARKVFSVTRQIAPREFRLALAKHLARRDFPTPPTSVLREVVLRLGFVQVHEDELVTTRIFDPEAELSGSELRLYHFLTENGPVVTFQELFEANREAGYKTITLAVRLKQSPIIRKVRHGLYALIGASFTQADIDEAASRVREVQARSELRYNIDGTVTYFTNAGPWLLYGGVMNSAELGAFAGEWYTPNGAKVMIGTPNFWGLDAVVEELELRLGERIALHLNLWNRTMTARRATDNE